jgi:DNA ligase (NAD+)
MGSLEKVNTPDELKAWAAKQGKATRPFLVTEKLDGISIALIMRKGKVIQALTRGDGTTGEDITANVRKMKGLPQGDMFWPDADLHVRGEIVLLKADLKEHFPGYKNPRNAAAGIAKRLDGEGSEHLKVLSYQVAEGSVRDSRATMMDQLMRWGFAVPFWKKVTLSEVIDEWERYQKETREALDYDIDGLVVEYDDFAYQLGLGEKDGRPHGARAFKFAGIAKETTLRGIQNQTGSQGRITPVGVFDPVDLMGTTVTNASLYNWKYIRDLGLDIGAKVLIHRAGDVIPRCGQIVTSTGTVAKPPTNCPSCDAPTEMDGEYLTCPNTAACPAQTLGRLQRYIKEQNILEWGEAVLERLIEAGKVKTVADLYRLKEKDLMSIDRMGAKSAAKLINTLWGKNPIPAEQFLGALAIPMCGSSTFELIMDAGYDTVAKIYAMTFDQLQAVKGLGPVKSETVHNWLKKNPNAVSEVEALGLKISNRTIGSLTGKSFCFTGKSTMKRADLEALVKSKGGTVKSSVGKGLTYLVMADPSSGSSKAQAAQKLGTETISEESFMKMANQ